MVPLPSDVCHSSKAKGGTPFPYLAKGGTPFPYLLETEPSLRLRRSFADHPGYTVRRTPNTQDAWHSEVTRCGLHVTVVADGHGGAVHSHAAVDAAQLLLSELDDEWSRHREHSLTKFVEAVRMRVDEVCKGIGGGTTFSIAVIDPASRMLHAANLGDSPVLVFRPHCNPSPVTTQHTPCMGTEDPHTP